MKISDRKSGKGNKSRLLALQLGTLLLILAVAGCSGGQSDKFHQELEKLQSSNMALRENAIAELEEMKLNEEQEKLLLAEAAKAFAYSGDDVDNKIPMRLIRLATRDLNPQLIPVIDKLFSRFPDLERIELLEVLARIGSKNAIKVLVKLAIQNYKEEGFFNVWLLNDLDGGTDVIFPRVFELTRNPDLKGSVYMLFASYLDKGIITGTDFPEQGDSLLAMCSHSRKVAHERELAGADVWADSLYDIARYEGGIAADALGYYKGENYATELKQFFTLKEPELRLFAAIALLRMGESVPQEILLELAGNSFTRNRLFDGLESMNLGYLFPAQFKTQKHFAESDMVHWLTYPAELGRLPDKIELMEVVRMDGGPEYGEIEFYLFRFKSEAPEVMEKDWMAGVSGFYVVKETPTTASMGYTFSAFERWDSKSPDEHVAEIQKLIDEAFRNSESGKK